MKNFLSALTFVILASCSASPVYAAEPWRFSLPAEQLYILGYDEPCAAELDFGLVFAAALEGVNPASLKRADVVHKGAAFKACWAPVGNGSVFIMDELGGFGSVKLGEAV